MSLALAHKRRVLAEGAAAVAASTPAYRPNEALDSPANAQKHLALMQAALDADLERISAINSREERQRLKRDELLPKYQGYVERYRAAGLSYPNPVLVQVLVWLFDTVQFEAGLELALFAIGDGQEMPERFKRRDVQTFVADEVIAWAEAEYKAGRAPEPYVSNLLPLVDGQWQLFERIPARYHKLLGQLAMDNEEWAQAIEHLDRAVALYPEIGVGVRRAAAAKALAKAEAEAAKQSDEGDEPPPTP
ncbi:TPA: terminase [Pseudomonas aeruginosa]|uniref:phage terminase small subunit n=1 Tax=Pseudomonas aeruginosa TaxID=287 RepID=UPI00207692D9|nr:phage terminase small subunit [Pseudomonas aeruginosa]MCM8572360.1 phage terminase small subunit [Pseudomonas aeruginosa]HDV4106858.1 terminase [Pseudomonas aeruginosa]HDV4161309.1 terminase [Pseudomonas aeruginosa]HDV4174448.1 terminase [Pseudomonas aeruginosa]HDV4193077.1 terminase [Pseudomonas aeruginosa]